MNRSHKIMMTALAVALSFAAPVLAGAEWTSAGNVTDYIEYGNGAEITLDSALKNPAGCTATSRYRPLSTLSQESRDHMTREILAAFMAKKKVALKIADGGSSACTEGSPAYYAVRISP